MTRHIFRISLLMLLGVVTSAAVAWGWMWLDVRRGYPGVSQFVNVPASDYEIGNERYLGGYGGRRNFGLQIVLPTGWPAGYDSLGPPARGDWPYWSSLRDVRVPYGGREAEYAAGIPFRAVLAYQIRGGGHEGAAAVAGSLLPYYPILPGLLANTAIYGSAWWAILFGPGVLIHWRRRRAGRCVKCGYNLRGLSPESDGVCPECGAAI